MIMDNIKASTNLSENTTDPEFYEDEKPADLNEETRLDVLRSLVYGETSSSIVARNDLVTLKDVETIAVQYATEIEQERAYRIRMEG